MQNKISKLISILSLTRKTQR